MSEASRGISRRTLVKGTAWAVPAVAVASAAPAMAKSGRGPVLDVQRACKQPGSSCANTNRPYNFVKGYTFTASIYNPSGETIYVYTSTPATPPGAYDPRFQVTSAVPFTYASARYFTPNLTPPYSGIGAPLDAYVTLSPGQTQYIIINAGANDNSSNQSASGSLFFAWGHVTTPGADPNHKYTPVPPPLTTVNTGWFGDSFSFPDMPPCDDCVPSPTTTTSTTLAGGRVAQSTTTTEPPTTTSTTVEPTTTTTTTDSTASSEG